jgi:hypothetical protein
MQLGSALRLWRVFAISAVGAALLTASFVSLVGAHSAAATSTTGATEYQPSGSSRPLRQGTLTGAMLQKVDSTAPEQAPPAVAPRDRMTPQQRATYYQSLAKRTDLPKGSLASNPVDPGAQSPNFVGGGVLPPIYKNFEGLNNAQSGDQWGFPDSTVATDLSYLMEGTNNAIAIYSGSTGALLFGPYTTASFFSPIKKNGTLIRAPEMVYDVMRDRWVVTALEIKPLNAGVAEAYIDIAISVTNSPTQPFPGAQYYEYQINTNVQPDVGVISWCDEDNLGIEYWGLYLSCTIFRNDTSGDPVGGGGNTTFTIPKIGFYSGSGGVYFFYNNVITTDLSSPAFGPQPAIEDGTPDAEFIVANDAVSGGPNNNLTLCALTNTVALNSGSPATFSCDHNPLPISYSDPLPVPQPGVGDTLFAGQEMSRVQYRAGRLFVAWTTPVAANGGAPIRDGAYWLDFEPQLTIQARTNPQLVNGIVIRNVGIYSYATNRWAFMPTLWSSSDADSALVFSEVSIATSVNASIVYTARRTTDPPNTMGQNNTSAFVVTGTHTTSGQWGRNIGCALPLNSVTRGIIWCAGQYNGSQASPGWNTRIYALRTE